MESHIIPIFICLCFNALSYVCMSPQHDINIEAELGYTVSQYKQLNYGFSQIDVIFQISNLRNLSLTKYNKPCDYLPRFEAAITAAASKNLTLQTQNHHTLIHRFQRVCRKFAKIRQTNLGLRMLYLDEIEDYRFGISRLQPQQQRRSKKSICLKLTTIFQYRIIQLTNATKSRSPRITSSVF